MITPGLGDNGSFIFEMALKIEERDLSSGYAHTFYTFFFITMLWNGPIYLNLRTQTLYFFIPQNVAHLFSLSANG